MGWLATVALGVGHPTCLQMTDLLEQNARSYDWQCIECKDCTECGVKGDDVSTRVIRGF